MKKFLAIMLTALLVLSMGTVAFGAEGDTPNYTDQTTVTVTKAYKLIGAGSSPAETFTLAQVGTGVVTDGDATAAPDLGTITGAVFEAGAAADPAATGNITIALPTYTTVGVYEYTLKEVAGTNAGVAYYGDDIKLVVTVINGENNKLRIAGVHTESEGEKSDTFVNTYSAGTLNVTKTVTGILGDKDKYFEFTVTLTGQDGKTYGESYAVTGGSYETNPTTIAIGTPTKFYLKDGETISIANLPYGVEYTVVETSYTDDGYTTTSEGDTGTINAAAQTAAYTNTKGGTPDTGIFTDSLPYIVVLGIVLIGGALFFFKRRRRAER